MKILKNNFVLFFIIFLSYTLCFSETSPNISPTPHQNTSSPSIIDAENDVVSSPTSPQSPSPSQMIPEKNSESTISPDDDSDSTTNTPFLYDNNESAVAPFSSNYHYTYAPFSYKYKVSKGVNFTVNRNWLYPKLTWFFIHNSEMDAMISVDWAEKEIGGTSVKLINTLNPDKRDVIFTLRRYKGKLFYIDPNRMFSLIGIKKNVTVLNKIRTKKLLTTATSVVWNYISLPTLKILRRHWSPIHPLIALHNNNIITLESFSDPAIFSKAQFQKNELTSFVLVTSLKSFNLLKTCHINVIYQKKLAYDGSLSDYALIHHLPYVNIETRLGNLEVQKNLAFVVAYKLFPYLFDKKMQEKSQDICGQIH